MWREGIFAIPSKFKIPVAVLILLLFALILWTTKWFGHVMNANHLCELSLNCATIPWKHFNKISIVMCAVVWISCLESVNPFRPYRQWFLKKSSQSGSFVYNLSSTYPGKPLSFAIWLAVVIVVFTFLRQMTLLIEKFVSQSNWKQIMSNVDILDNMKREIKAFPFLFRNQVTNLQLLKIYVTLRTLIQNSLA